jgi:signal peptidase II
MPYFYLLFLVCGVDQAVKLWVMEKLVPLQSFVLIRGLVSITYVLNYGAAFGIMYARTYLLLAITAGTFVYAWIKRHEVRKYPQMFQIGIAVALGGALGNFVDRFRLGYVVDFLDFYIWPVFNIADVAIVVGVGLVIAGLINQEMRLKKDRVQPDEKGSAISREDNS